MPLLPVWISRLDVQGQVVVLHSCHGDLGGARPEPPGAGNSGARGELRAGSLGCTAQFSIG